MSFSIKTTVLVTLAALAAVSHADPRPQKQPLQVDFNKMIDENNIDRGDLAKVDHQAPTSEDGRRKVIDFVDMEVGVGQEHNVGRN